MLLNGGSIKQGDTRFIYSSLNRDELDDDHPLKALGFLTAGYSVILMAKISKSDADVAAAFSITLTPSTADIATGEIAPANTKGLSVPLRGLPLLYEVQISNETAERVFTIEEGEFTVKKELIKGV